jgi:hypothetical protein
VPAALTLPGFPLPVQEMDQRRDRGGLLLPDPEFVPESFCFCGINTAEDDPGYRKYGSSDREDSADLIGSLQRGGDFSRMPRIFRSAVSGVEMPLLENGRRQPAGPAFEIGYGAVPILAEELRGCRRVGGIRDTPESELIGERERPVSVTMFASSSEFTIIQKGRPYGRSAIETASIRC